MPTSALRASIVALVVACLAGTPAEATAQRRQDRTDVDTSFALDRSGTVSIRNGSETIIVTSWDQATIRVRGHGDRGALRFSTSTGRVTIDPSRSGDDVVIQVQVPRGVRIEARTNSGDISIRGTGGDVDAQTSSGDIQIVDARAVSATSLSGEIEVRQTSGSVTVTTSNGDLGIEDVHGDIDATSISGDLMIARAVAKVVRATTTNGDISYSGTIEAAGRYDLTTHSGDIELAIPRDASALVSLSTWNGDVASEFPITLKAGTSTISSTRTKHFTFTLGGGSARVNAETFSGDIAIISRGGR